MVKKIFYFVCLFKVYTHLYKLFEVRKLFVYT